MNACKTCGRPLPEEPTPRTALMKLARTVMLVLNIVLLVCGIALLLVGDSDWGAVLIAVGMATLGFWLMTG